MALATPHIGACSIAGGAVRNRHQTVDSTVPVWSAFGWKPGDMVRTQAAGGQETVWLATSAHSANDPDPATNPSGWVALSASPTQVPAWTQGDSYALGEPVRLDMPNGQMRLFVASVAIANSQNSPGTAAGIGDGWVEVTTVSPPPVPPFDATATYRNGDLARDGSNEIWVATGPIAAGGGQPGTLTGDPLWQKFMPRPTVTTRAVLAGANAVPQAADPANPAEGDRFVNASLKVTWVYADDPMIPGRQLVWVRESRVVYHADAARVAGAFPAGATVAPDPALIAPESGDIVMVTDAAGAIVDTEFI